MKNIPTFAVSTRDDAEPISRQFNHVRIKLCFPWKSDRKTVLQLLAVYAMPHPSVWTLANDGAIRQVAAKELT